MRSTPKIRLALATGDPAGIGPEISLRAAQAMAGRLAANTLDLILVGSRAVFERCARSGDGGLAGVTDLPGVRVVDVPDIGEIHAPGQLSAAAGELAYRAAVAAVGLVQAGKADAIVTAPLNKEALYLAGRNYAGYTDLLAHLTQSQQAVMMLAHGRIRISHVTTHVALRDVPDLITPQRLERVITLTAEALAAFGVPKPRMAVAALNPHAGEGGNFGTEDDRVTRPTVDRLRAAGMDVDGPVPGDTVFVKHVAGQYDAVVAMYHDQGHVPFKLLGFRIDPATGVWDSLKGTNITLGLPVIRTSVDHGTAFDIAGRGIANPGSMIEAIEVAEQLILGRRDLAKTTETTETNTTN